MVLLALEASVAPSELSLSARMQGERFQQLLACLRVWSVRPGGVAMQLHALQQAACSIALVPALPDIGADTASSSCDDIVDMFDDMPPRPPTLPPPPPPAEPPEEELAIAVYEAADFGGGAVVPFLEGQEL